MSRIFIAALLLLVVGGAEAGAATPPCHADKLSSSNGTQIGLTSGQVFQTYPGSEGIVSTWLPLDKLSVCQIGGSSVQISNLTKGSRSIKAIRLYQKSSGQI